MRALVLPLMLMAALSPLAPGQDTFQDPDFGASMTLPSGMRVLSAEELARVGGTSPDDAINIPRADSPTGKVTHVYIWVDDTSPYNRQISLHLYDAAPPFRTPSQLREAHQQEGLLVDYEEIIPPPLNGLRIEGTFRRQPDNREMRRTVVYVPDMARERFALLSLQANASDWEIVKSELLEVVQSLRLEGIRTSANMTRMPPGGQAQGYPAGAAGTASATESSSDWGQLEVAGSLLLAALLIGSLILSGRATP